MVKPQILVVDDKENILKLFMRILADNFEVTTASNGEQARELIIDREFDVVVTDIRMPGADGFEVLKAVKASWPKTAVILMTAYGAVPDAVQAMKKGAFDYIQKPFDPDVAGALIQKAVEHRRQEIEAQTLAQQHDGILSFHNLIGKSARMRAVYDLLGKAAELDITVLITGETGTGKELAARAVHYHSPRKQGRFVAVNCGALPIDLVESELFGHAKGAFTGATGAKPGLFEEANLGSLFLDEIAELPLASQVKLLRVLQDKEVRRVGETRSLPVDVRIMAATHRDLKAEAAAGRFREDLLYRLHVFPIHMPALRERREDISLLATSFLEKHARALRRNVTSFDAESMQLLLHYPWPGNVRELENAIERAIAVSTGSLIRAADLPPEVSYASNKRLAAETPPSDSGTDAIAKRPYKEAVEEARERVSRDYLVALLHEFQGNVTKAAERAGMERESLHRLLKRHGLRSDDFKPRSS